MRTIIIILSINFVLWGCTSSKKLFVEEYLQQIPDEFRPDFLNQLPEFLNTDQLSSEFSKTKDNAANIVTYSAPENGRNMFAQVMPTDNETVYITCFDHIFEAFTIRIIKLENGVWSMCTEEAIPTEIIDLINQGLRIFPELENQKITLMDMDDNQKIITLKWKKNKFILENKIPEKMGKSME